MIGTFFDDLDVFFVAAPALKGNTFDGIFGIVQSLPSFSLEGTNRSPLGVAGG